jgi:PTH1 family peptidyl-tRNA hydrolase
MKLVVGLGNPGMEYKKTRHNVGFIFLNSFLSKEHLSLDKKKFNGKYIEYVSKKGNKAILLEPQTYMNLSGDSIIDFIRYFKIDVNDVLVIHDDLDLDIAKIRIRSKGSSGGHNGIKSIINRLQNENFKRIRIGIGKDSNIPVVDYVLGKFSSDDMIKLEEKFNIVNRVIEDFIDDIDFHTIESKYN